MPPQAKPREAKLPAPTYPCFACLHCFATLDSKKAAKTEASEMEAAETDSTVTDVSNNEDGEGNQKKHKDDGFQDWLKKYGSLKPNNNQYPD
jgi:hypothetical protein